MRQRKQALKELRFKERKYLMDVKYNDIPGIKHYDKFPEWVREKYYQTVQGVCQLCHKKMLYKDVEFHRINRKGSYTLCKLNHPEQNVMIVHSECHKKLHENELGCGSHSY